MCKPASMCTFQGKIVGKSLTVSNAAKVDSEGGKVENTLTLSVASPAELAGTSSSAYRHPSGMSCTWGSKIKLARQ